MGNNMESFTTVIYNAFRETLGVDPNIPAEVDFTFHSGDPGYLSGLPDKCYPPEPAELEIIAVNSPSTSRSLVTTDEILDQIENDIIDQIEAQKRDQCPPDDDLDFEDDFFTTFDIR